MFHVTNASGEASIALANTGASLVGSNEYAALTFRSEGSLVMCGGISKNECHASASKGNFDTMFRSASSIIWGEMIGIISLEKHDATITPAAPVGELNPARSALVSRNTLDLFCIGAPPYLIPTFLDSAAYSLFGVERSRPLLFRQIEICLDLHPLNILLQGNKFLEYGSCLIHALSVGYSEAVVNSFYLLDSG